MGYGMQIVTTLIMVLVNVLLPSVMEEYNTLVDGSGITTYGLMWVISTLVLPPLVEEAGFRGLGLTYLERAGVPFAVANIVQALAFGIFHMNLPGVRLNNSNWPHILRAMRVWLLGAMVLFPLLWGALAALWPGRLSAVRLALVLVFCLGLFVPAMLAARRHA